MKHVSDGSDGEGKYFTLHNLSMHLAPLFIVLYSEELGVLDI